MAAPRDALKDLWYSGQKSFLSAWWRRSNPPSPWYSGSTTHSNTVIPFLACWFKGRGKWPGGCLSFQFSGMFVVAPVRNTPPSGIKTSRPAKLKFKGTGNKAFLVGL